MYKIYLFYILVNNVHRYSVSIHDGLNVYTIIDIVKIICKSKLIFSNKISMESKKKIFLI